ncbi:nuclear transport factor 2 family protein [Frankia sp. Ag45/Mut15]|uniref:Nuclear transport factor 2 family protein n=1 Tax=Frankia umida TaxID=573489 RepID=A0ABT0JUW5_9ACTN|nr:nuclear transport factor 2 family protein [Frankia umida]MCK9875336.1 nuclear transport factor 2 family protein [Frankia umida]
MSDAVADELAIRDTLVRYCHLLDDGKLDELLALFTPDAVFAFGAEHQGTAALAAFFEKSQGTAEQRGRHVTVNTLVEIDGDGAVAVSDFLYFGLGSPAPEPRLIGRYTDTLSRNGNRWRIARRDAVLASRS